MHQCFKFILFWNDTLHVSDGLSIHHQHFKTVHTATGICQTDTAVCSRQYLFDICLLLYVQSLTPDDGQKDRPKHVQCYSNKINLIHWCTRLVLLQKYITMHGPMKVKVSVKFRNWERRRSLSVASLSLYTTQKLLPVILGALYITYKAIHKKSLVHKLPIYNSSFTKGTQNDLLFSLLYYSSETSQLWNCREVRRDFPWE